MLLFCLTFSLECDPLFDQLEHNRTDLQDLLMHDIYAPHLHVCINFICFLVAQFLELDKRCFLIQDVYQMLFNLRIFIETFAGRGAWLI